MVEPSKTQIHKKNIIVCRSVASMNGDRWIPVRILNNSEKAVTLNVFSRSKLDCGLAKDFVHRIHLSDELPFRLPYRCVPPGEYHKLRQVLTDMEECEIIHKSNSEWAAPLVLVWKKNGDLRICMDYRWLNARTIKDAHPLPHQSDCLAALGGSAILCAMDLTSGFYNIAMAKEDKKLTAFTTPMGLYEFNMLPQGLCNSPASIMRLMMGIFGYQNFLTLLCYLDDVLVYAKPSGGLRHFSAGCVLMD